MKPCPAKNCPEKIQEGLIFCVAHWQRLPTDLKKKLLKHYPLGAVVLQQEIPTGYQAILRQCVGFLELKAGQPKTKSDSIAT